MEKKITKKAWKAMSLEERRALMPKKLSKLGEWMFDPNRPRVPSYTITDMKAILK